jgi:hypothetical protein
MTAARSAAPQPRRTTTPSRPATAMSAPMRAAPAFALDNDEGDEIRINLADVPRMSLAVESSMHVEGFKPSLLSRFVGLFMPKI